SAGASTAKNSTSDMGIPASTFFKELTEGLTLFFSIIEMVLLVTPARLASSRWDRPLSLRMVFSRAPTSKVGILWAIQMGSGGPHDCTAVHYFQRSPLPESDLIASRYPVQIAEQLVGNGPGMAGHLAGIQPIAPKPYVAAQPAARQPGQIHRQHVHGDPPADAGALAVHQHRCAVRRMARITIGIPHGDHPDAARPAGDEPRAVADGFARRNVVYRDHPRIQLHHRPQLRGLLLGKVEGAGPVHHDAGTDPIAIGAGPGQHA